MPGGAWAFLPLGMGRGRRALRAVEKHRDKPDLSGVHRPAESLTLHYQYLESRRNHATKLFMPFRFHPRRTHPGHGDDTCCRVSGRDVAFEIFQGAHP